jgi:hypothetical protein
VQDEAELVHSQIVNGAILSRVLSTRLLELIG